MAVRHVGCWRSKPSTQTGRKIALSVWILLLRSLKETLALDFGSLNCFCCSEPGRVKPLKPRVLSSLKRIWDRSHHQRGQRAWKVLTASWASGDEQSVLIMWSEGTREAWPERSPWISLRPFTSFQLALLTCSLSVSLGGFLLSCFLQWRANKTYTENRRWNQSRKNEQRLS